MTTFDRIIDRELPGSLRDADYVARTVAALKPLGFTAERAIACVATCRDEICRPVRDHVQRQWGEAFNLSSLGGMITLGRTGFGAFHAHAPQIHDRRQHVYYAMPHLGIGANGTPGEAERRGIPAGSLACGALFSFAKELASGTVDITLDPHDIEQSLLKARMVKAMQPGDQPGPIELVKLAERVIREDLEVGIADTVDTDEVDYALFTGIQIHGPDRIDYVHPVASYAVVGGERRELSLAG